MLKYSLTFILSCFSLLVISQNEFVAAGRPIVAYTALRGQCVNWYSVPSTFVFKFKFYGTTFTINLNTVPLDAPHWSKVIGIMHPGNGGVAKIWREGEEVLSKQITNNNPTMYEWKSYWIKWTNQHIYMGLEGETSPFISYDNIEPFEFETNFIGVSIPKDSDVPATWIIENNY